jgi:hypothetical protein
MFSAQEPEAVLDELGDKVAIGLGRGVNRVRTDLDDYRRLHPEWVARHSPRGLANWLHDQLWGHIRAELHDLPGVHIRERGATRELMVHNRYRVRVKRHDQLGDVSTYLTQTAIEFLAQPSAQLPGLEEVHLIAGYEWDNDELKIVRPVLSMRDGKDHHMWVVGLPEPGDTQSGPVALPPTPAPPGPQIEVKDPGLRRTRETETDAPR